MDLETMFFLYFFQRLTLSNVMISHAGVRLFLGKLEFGDEIDAFEHDIEHEKQKRHTQLLQDFALLLYEMTHRHTIPDNRHEFLSDYIGKQNQTVCLRYDVSPSPPKPPIATAAAASAGGKKVTTASASTVSASTTVSAAVPVARDLHVLQGDVFSIELPGDGIVWRFLGMERREGKVEAEDDNNRSASLSQQEPAIVIRPALSDASSVSATRFAFEAVAKGSCLLVFAPLFVPSDSSSSVDHLKRNLVVSVTVETPFSHQTTSEPQQQQQQQQEQQQQREAHGVLKSILRYCCCLSHQEDKDYFAFSIKPSLRHLAAHPFFRPVASSGSLSTVGASLENPEAAVQVDEDRALEEELERKQRLHW